MYLNLSYNWIFPYIASPCSPMRNNRTCMNSISYKRRWCTPHTREHSSHSVSAPMLYCDGSFGERMAFSTKFTLVKFCIEVHGTLMCLERLFHPFNFHNSWFFYCDRHFHVSFIVWCKFFALIVIILNGMVHLKKLRTSSVVICFLEQHSLTNLQNSVLLLFIQ